MKKSFTLTLFYILLSFLPLILGNNVAHARDVDPWPASVRLPFPWENIQGTWAERRAQFAFSFKVIENTSGEKHIKIRQLDTTTGEVVAQGLGLENSEKVVVAGMTAGHSKQYRLTIRALRDFTSWGPYEFTGVTIESFDGELLFHFEIRKIKDLPLTESKEQSYKNLRCESIIE